MKVVQEKIRITDDQDDFLWVCRELPIYGTVVMGLWNITYQTLVGRYETSWLRELKRSIK